MRLRYDIYVLAGGSQNPVIFARLIEAFELASHPFHIGRAMTRMEMSGGLYVMYAT
ncbi:hypothetical protein AB4Z25_24880 [Rhizobium sp. RAF36]|uniref:hypothetical protein n=1 Tax=Rhizobium sp. RAF36 TaxID=3233055 RepID=UPI003F9E0E36